MQLLLQFVLLIVGFFFLVKGADVFVDGASAVAEKLGISQLIIGLTIVAMGTSLPEAAISISAAAKDSAGIAVGNVLGSNTMNILLILGLTAVIAPIAVKRSLTRIEMPFLLVISLLLPALGLPDNQLSRVDGLILFVLFVAYLVYLFFAARKHPELADVGDEAASGDDAKEISTVKAVAMVVIGAAMIVVGSNVTVDAACEIARALGMSERLIGLSIVALGTSLPELVTSVTAAIKGKTDIAVGNIVGSNLFNILFVLSLSSIITPIPYAAAFVPDTIICVATAFLLEGLIMFDFKLNRPKGLVMLAAFVGYYGWLFIKG